LAIQETETKLLSENTFPIGNQKTNYKPKIGRPRSITPYFHSFHFTIALLDYKR